MKKERVSRADLKKKSEQFHIPVSNLIVGLIMERFIYLLSESEYAGHLWLKTEKHLEEIDFSKVHYLTIPLVYKLEEKGKTSAKEKAGQELSEELIEHMLFTIFQPDNSLNWKDRDFKWSYVYEWDRQQVIVDVTAEFEEMKIPLQLKIDVLMLSNIHSEKKSFVPIYDNQKQVIYRHYPMEGILVEQLIEIIQYLELIPTMDAYANVYHIISKEMIDGRKVKERIEELCKCKEIDITEKRGQILLSYEDYPYMKKRWEKYRKANKKAELAEWKEISGRIYRFLIPIWESIRKDEVFFGDWMPEIGRYLE